MSSFQTVPSGTASHADADFSDLTIIIPTLNEAGSIGELLGRLGIAAPGATVLVVDDESTDGTPEAVKLASKQAAAKQQAGRFLLLERKGASVRGIAASVLDACAASKTEYLVVMDADFQHPPAVVPDLCRELRRGADIVVACRESIGGKFSIVRVLISALATAVARARLKISGVDVHDPLSGFFALRTDDLMEVARHGGSRIQLSGYKILFDYLKLAPRLLGHSRDPLRIQEVIFSFGERTHGKSKLRASHVIDFIRSIVS